MSKTAPKLKFTGKVKELMCLDSHITILDNKVALIENCKQIIECNNVLARVNTSDFTVEIWGNNLFLNSFSNNNVEVRGVIDTISLTSRSKKERN